jgi:hypothetical protein
MKNYKIGVAFVLKIFMSCFSPFYGEKKSLAVEAKYI